MSLAVIEDEAKKKRLASIEVEVMAAEGYKLLSETVGVKIKEINILK